MSNIFPIKELEQHRNYIIGMDAYDENNPSVSIGFLDGKVLSYPIREDKDFFENVKKLSK